MEHLAIYYLKIQCRMMIRKTNKIGKAEINLPTFFYQKRTNHEAVRSFELAEWNSINSILLFNSIKRNITFPILVVRVLQSNDVN